MEANPKSTPAQRRSRIEEIAARRSQTPLQEIQTAIDEDLADALDEINAEPDEDDDDSEGEDSPEDDEFMFGDD